MAKSRNYKQEHVEFIQNNAPQYTNKELLVAFNNEFGLSITFGMLRGIMKNRKIKTGIRDVSGLKRSFTPEEENFLRKHIPGKYIKELTAMLNKEFNQSHSEDKVRGWKKSRKLTSGVANKFSKGHVPATKGTKGVYNVGGNSGSFKKGQAPHNRKPVGAEVIRPSGYVWVKVDDSPKGWRQKQVVEWEKHHGKVKKGHVIIFLDNDYTNNHISNLKMISRADHTRMNTRGYRSTDPELTEVGYLKMKLDVKLDEIKKERKNGK